ncbi:MAG: DapH/DapD/GlmU-related protein [Candidatus Diapherotrites archaeon]
MKENTIESILAETEKLISKNKAFEYWLVLEKSEKALESIREQILGIVEPNVMLVGKAIISKGTIIKSGTRIEGPVYIGKNCVIGPNAYLRPGTIISDNCHIGTSEIKNSIILSETKIPHFSYVGDSIIGKNCNLGAGTKIANLRHDSKNIVVIIDGKKIDSKRRKLGALVFDNVKTGINCSINCGAIIMQGETLLPNSFRK